MATDDCRGSRKDPSIWNALGKTRWTSPTAGFDPPGYTWSYVWSTTIFDLRPDLKSIIGATKQGFPIWDTSARLYISLNGTLANNLVFNGQNLTVTAVDYVQILDANVQGGAGSSPGSSPSPNLIRLQTQDVSAVFFPPAAAATPGIGNVMGVFSRPGDSTGGGEGYPVRFWRLELTFSYFVPEDLPLPAVATPPNDLVITAGMS